MVRDLPRGYQSTILEQVPAVARKAYSLAASNGNWPVYLWGPTGTGKTCCAAMAYALWPGKAAQWLSLTQLCEDLLRFNASQSITIYSGGQPVEVTKSQYWARLERTGLLVIDEIGTRESTGHRFDALLTVLELRKSKPLVVTGNLSPKALSQVYDERVLSRVCQGTLIEFTGEDRRLEGVGDRVYRV